MSSLSVGLYHATTTFGSSLSLSTCPQSDYITQQPRSALLFLFRHVHKTMPMMLPKTSYLQGAHRELQLLALRPFIIQWSESQLLFSLAWRLLYVRDATAQIQSVQIAGITASTQRALVTEIHNPFPCAPFLVAEHRGHLIPTSEDTTGAVWQDLACQQILCPNDYTLQSHALKTPKSTGYLDRIKAITKSYDSSLVNKTYTFPPRTTGYEVGFPCTYDQ
jgi:hypothetical protein